MPGIGDVGGLLADPFAWAFAKFVAAIVAAVGGALETIDGAVAPDLAAAWVDEGWRRTIIIGAWAAFFGGTVATVAAAATRGAGGVVRVAGRLAVIPVGMVFAVPFVTGLLGFADAATAVFSADMQADGERILAGMTAYAGSSSAAAAAALWFVLAFFALLAAVVLTVELYLRSVLIVAAVVAVPFLLGVGVLDRGLTGLRRAAKFVAVLALAKPAVAFVFMLGALPLVPDGGASGGAALAGLATVTVAAAAPWLLFAAVKSPFAAVAGMSHRASPAGMYTAAAGSAPVRAARLFTAAADRRRTRQAVERLAPPPARTPPPGPGRAGLPVVPRWPWQPYGDPSARPAGPVVDVAARALNRPRLALPAGTVRPDPSAETRLDAARTARPGSVSDPVSDGPRKVGKPPPGDLRRTGTPTPADPRRTGIPTTGRSGPATVPGTVTVRPTRN